MDESGFWFIQEDAYQGDHAPECAEKASLGAISQPLDMASTAAAEMRMPFERVASFLARPDSIPRGYPRLPIPPLAERGPGMMYELNQEQYKKIMSEVASAGAAWTRTTWRQWGSWWTTGGSATLPMAAIRASLLAGCFVIGLLGSGGGCG